MAEEKPIVYKVPKDVQKRSIETMKVREDTLEYLRQNGFKTIGETVEKYDEIPAQFGGNIMYYLMFVEPKENQDN